MPGPANIATPVAAFSGIVVVDTISLASRSGGCNSHARPSILSMTLETILKTAILNLRSGRLDREEDVKIAVILPILNALDWNPADPGSLRPEYPAGSGRVDYALLCHGRPQVFVEAKRRGALDARAEAQLFGYAANNGVPLLVLSDGLCWDFYLSMADGHPEERRFRRLELRDEDRVPQYAEALEECLRKRQVASGEARRGAENRLEDDRSRNRAREAMPDAWNSLLNEPDELLCDLLSDRVRDRIGVAPPRSDVEQFLQRLPAAGSSSTRSDRRSSRQPERLATDGPWGNSPEAGLSQIGDGVSRRQDSAAAASSAPSSEATDDVESLQDIVRDLTRTVLEDFPETLSEEQIGRLETERNPLGLKIGNHALLRSISDGPKIGGQNRYWKHHFAGRWHVCSQWWKQDHLHNARALSTWVKSLIAGTKDAEARERLLDILDRLSALGE